MDIARYEVGARLSQAVKHGDTIYLAGQVDDSAPSVKAQTEGILRKVDACLKHFGSDKTKILAATIYLTDIGDFAAVNAVYGKHMPDPPPARSTFQVAKLPSGALVEIEAVALVS